MIFNKKLLVSAVAASGMVLTACNDDNDNNNKSFDLTKGKSLTRIASVPLGAEVTGMFVAPNGEMFFNVQHPDAALAEPENSAAVGIWTGVDFNNLNPEISELAVPAEDNSVTPAIDKRTTTQVSQGEYQVLGRSGDEFAGALPFGLGAVINAAGNARILLSQDPDFNAFIPTNNDATEGYLYVVWESRPGSMQRLDVKMTNNQWSVTAGMDVDFSAVKGTLINCFGVLSPWGTPMTSEENYEAENTARWNDVAYTSGYPNSTDIDLLTDYLGGEFPNPYNYGYIVEITNAKSAKPTPVKHFTMGRSAHENPSIMPDNKTVYLTDDGSSKGFYKFVADNASDMSSGTLYAAKIKQDESVTDSAKAGFDITWIRLASSNNTDIKKVIDTYNDIDRSSYVEGETSYIKDADILKNPLHAFIETLRYSAASGATTEFNKMEGIAINYEGLKAGTAPYMYVAMSSVEKAMSDATGDINVSTNKCGIVYRIALDNKFNAFRMDPVVVGGTYDKTQENKCPTDSISNPDNLVVLADGRVLIGEDSGNHVNNMIWAYNPHAK